MNALEFFMMSVALACLLGPLVGALSLVGYQLLLRLGRRGFTLRVGLPPQPPQLKEKRPYDG